jgi:hypothetical protein
MTANEDDLDRPRMARANQVAPDSAANEAAPHDSTNGAIALFAVVLGLSFVLYFMPSIMAMSRGHHDAAAIITLNFFLGWTFVGWVVAICRALTQVEGTDAHFYLHDQNYSTESEAPPRWLS